MGRPKKFTKQELEEKWEEYKNYCDNREIVRTEFSQKTSEFITCKQHKYVTYTIEGFCKFLKLARSAFYDTYCKDHRLSDIVTRMREECEIDAREKFEMEAIPSKLAGMWMGHYDNYRPAAEIEAKTTNEIKVVFESDDDAEELTV